MAAQIIDASKSRRDFFISYNRADQTWAEWVAWQLEAAGYRVFIQAWDFRPGHNFVLEMNQAATLAERTVPVLSPNFLASRFTQPEWAAAFADDPTGEQGRVVPVRVAECDPNGLLGPIVYIDLVGRDEAKAKDELLRGVRRGRVKPPAPPVFPGSAAPVDRPTAAVAKPARFPGTLPRKHAAAEARQISEQQFAAFRDINEPWCPEMVALPAGQFLMGSPPDEEGRSDAEGPQHKVTIEYRFALGRYAVTFAEYDHFCKVTAREKPADAGWGRGKRPVINVSWLDAKAYVGWLVRETGQPYRLPSEAEWEYACRAGITTPFSFGRTISPEQANYDGNYTYAGSFKGIYRKQTVPVGSFPANPWGLHEMHGNVWEWVEDLWHDSYSGAPVDGAAWTDEKALSYRRDTVVRGGAWLATPWVCRSAFRYRHFPEYRFDLQGFRVARTLF